MQCTKLESHPQMPSPRINRLQLRKKDTSRKSAYLNNKDNKKLKKLRNPKRPKKAMLTSQ